MAGNPPSSVGPASVTVEPGASPLPITAASLPLPTGASRDATLTDQSQRLGSTTPVSLAALPALPAGANNIGDVDVLTLPALPAGNNNIGDVDVVTLPAVTQGTTPWKAREDTTAMTWVSTKTAAPTASAVQADTGALAAGDYDFDVYLVCADSAAVGKGLVVEHRNAANGATLQTLGGCSVPGQVMLQLRRYTMATNERLRIIAGTAAGAASSMYVSAIGRRVS